MGNWNSLSQYEKADIMRLALQNGIYNLNDIRSIYNEYAEGGDKGDDNTLKPEQRIENGIIYDERPRQRVSSSGFHHVEDPNSTYAKDAEGNLYDYSTRLPELTVSADNRTMQEKMIDAYRGLGRNPIYHSSPIEQMEEGYNFFFPGAMKYAPTALGAVAAAPTVISAASNPAVQAAAKQMLFSTAAGMTADKAVEAVTGKTIGENTGDLIERVTGWNPRTGWLGEMATDMANPFYYLSAEKYLPKAGYTQFMPKTTRPAVSANTKPFTSELDWSPEGWFGTRATGKWDAEDIASLQSHIPEYLEIEQLAKANGTWLKMPDGSTWKGDPRSWVQMQSKAYDNYTGDSPFKHQPFSHTSGHKFDTFDISHFGETDKGFYGRGHYTHPAEYINGKMVGRNKYGDENYLLTTNVEHPFDLNNPNFEWASAFNREKTNAPEGIFDGYDSVYYGIPGNNFVGAFPAELVVPKAENYKSLLGNNGNFNPLNPNMYKALIPIIGGYSAINTEK